MNELAQYRLLTTRLEFLDALREGLAECAQTGCRELWLSDEDFADWPLSEPAVIEQLTRWAMPHRRLVVIARQFDEVVRRHARWVEWRRQWSHVVQCRAFEDAQADEVPTLLLGTGLVCVRLFDKVHHRGALSRESADCMRCHEAIDAVSQRCVESFPSTTLGL